MSGGGSAPLSRSARSVIPRSILRSITSEPGSIASIARRPPSEPPTRMRLRLSSRVPPCCSSRTNVQTQAPSSERDESTRSGSRISTRMPIAPFGLRSTSPTSRCWKLGQDLLGAVHLEAEQVLDPVVRVGAAAARPHLDEPGPDRRGRRVHRDRPRRDDVGMLEQLVSGETTRGLLGGRAPVEDGLTQEAPVDRGQRDTGEEHAEQPSSSLRLPPSGRRCARRRGVGRSPDPGSARASTS